MHYEIHYDNQNPVVADAAAIRDAQEYLGPDMWEKLVGEVFNQDADAAGYKITKEWINTFRIACMMLGIQGRPVSALCRAFIGMYPNRVMKGS